MNLIHSMSRMLFTIPAMLLLVVGTQTRGEVSQKVILALDDNAGDRVDSDSGEVSAPTSDGILTDISASISGPGYEAVGAVGRFGQLGVRGQQDRSGEMFSQVLIFSDEFVNTLGRPLRAEANFIIDGGELILGFAPGATLKFQLDVTAEIFQDDTPTCSIITCPHFQTIIELEDMLPC